MTDDPGDGNQAAERVEHPVLVDTNDGDALLAASWIGTGVLAVASVVAVASASLESVLIAVSLIMFALGIVLFIRAFLFAVNVRREDLIGIGGLFFLAGSAPRRVQRSLLGSFGAQAAIGLATAIIRPYTALAFAVLASMYGLGLCGLWGAIHGTFPRRPVH
ncbi:MAG: hypothetical protein HYX32_00290 [Actinobacteria bacterium]|nr:hypothetical protein [Actinomycetota bacterium]